MSLEKEALIIQWKNLRGEYFNLYQEDKKKFAYQYDNHPLYSSVMKHIDKSFRDVNQIAEVEIEKIISKKTN